MENFFPRRRQDSPSEENDRRIAAQRALDRMRRLNAAPTAAEPPASFRSLLNYEKTILKQNFENYLNAIQIRTSEQPFISARIHIEVSETTNTSEISFSSPNVPCPPPSRSYDVYRTDSRHRVNAPDPRTQHLGSSGISFDAVPAAVNPDIIDLRNYSDETIREPRDSQEASSPPPLPPRSPSLTDSDDETTVEEEPISEERRAVRAAIANFRAGVRSRTTIIPQEVSEEEDLGDGEEDSDHINDSENEDARFPWVDTRSGASGRFSSSSGGSSSSKEEEKKVADKEETTKNDSCVICVEDREQVMMIECSSCKQSLCVLCISKFEWSTRNTCPFCRSNNCGWEVYSDLRKIMRNLTVGNRTPTCVRS